MNPNGLSTGVVRVMGRSESRQWRSAMAAATTASPEQRPTTARTIVRVSTATNVMISIINHLKFSFLRAAVITAHLFLALLLGARKCRVCNTRVPLLSELPTTAAYLHPNFKAYEASLSFESPPRVERCIEVFEYLPLPFLSSFYLTPPKWKKSQETNRGSWKSHLTLSMYRRGVK
jgi:hypothetical protein